ncbi:MAG: DUF1016 family protein [Bacteroidales bacterium]|nr:DUF1016 family protein [Bacteroidales bacterium]
MENKETKVVRIHDVKIDQEYVQWLSEIKARYRNAQIKASIRINVEQLLFNWQLGRDLVVRKAEEKWGSGIVEQVSLDLQAEFPGSKGFSTTNLWYMKQWYQFYAGSAERIHQLGGEIQGSDIQINKKLHQLGGEILKPETASQHGVELPNLFALVPWRHHVEIIAKCKNVDEALFYIVHTASEGWSRQALMNSIKADFYHTSGGAITNFSEKLPAPQSKLAQAITKDTYDFGFISLPNDYEEEQLELALERQLTRFLLELGTGFSYLGRQRQIVVAGKPRKLDMLFFHIPLNCYIVVELKVVPFQPEFAGKLNFYVNAVDDLIKTPSQNPTIGLLICSNKDETEVQYAFKGVQTPMGVASYDNIQIKKIQEQLPTVEELKARIRLLEEELNKGK